MIDFNINEIAPLCEDFGVEITPEICNKLNLYGNLLLEWNQKINLTAITEPPEVLYKHFYDCILFFKRGSSSLIFFLICSLNSNLLKSIPFPIISNFFFPYK